ncbi:Organic cation transporter protein [Nymphon striatum]|nr:Organic cation transporter protein [Nymphon striatum]
MTKTAFEDITSGLRRWQVLLGLLDMFIAMLTCPAHFAMPYFAPKVDSWCAPPSHLHNVSSDLWRNLSGPHSDALGGPSQCETYDFDYSNVTADGFEKFAKSVMNSSAEVKKCDSWSYDTSVWKKTIVGDVTAIRECILALLANAHFSKLIPESPRWLISVGKFDEALITMKKIAKINGQTLPSDETIMAELRELEYKIKNKSQNQASIADLFRTKNMRRKTIILYYICCHDSRDVETSESNTDTTTTTFSFPGPNVWQAVTLKHGIETAATRQQQFANQGLTCNRFVVALIYFALSLNMQDLGGDLFVSMAIAGSLNIFGYFLTVLVMSKIGRRIPTAASLIVGGVFLAMSMLLPKSVGWLNIIIVLIGRTAISMTFSLIYVFTPEVHPTVDDISSPYISKTILAVLAITAGLSTLGLPETKDRNLPETLEDGENYEL